MQPHYPVIIVGAGPGGATASIYLSKLGIKHLLLEKAVFPRDKICGDAISAKGLDMIGRHYFDELKAFSSSQQSIYTSGIRFVAPSGRGVNIPFPEVDRNLPLGFLSKRLDFDNFLFDLAAKESTVDVHQGVNIKEIAHRINHVEVQYEHGLNSIKATADLIIGADGERSIVKKSLDIVKNEDEHFCAGIRSYMTGVTGFTDGNYLELIFLKETIPGYFWIFPLSDGHANVGLGMRSDYVKRKHLNLKKILQDIITTHPEYMHRFADATPVGPTQGWGLPLGSKRNRSISGERFMLVGDAGSLIDPFTGEGIGNAIVSGKVAATVAEKALQSGKHSAAFLKTYDEEIYRKLGSELQLSYIIQRLSRRQSLFNFVVRKIDTNPQLKSVFTNMFTDLEIRKKLRSPAFYWNLLIGR